MTSKLKPLILPQLVEDRRKLGDNIATQEVVVEVSPIFLSDNTSSSDVTSPATPTFSHRSGTLGHLRCSSSTSSLDLALPSPSYPECPASPTTVTTSSAGTAAQAKHTVGAAPKRPLPDVQEEDSSEKGDDEEAILSSQPDLYGCLCDEPCEHAAEAEFRRFSSPRNNEYTYDLDLVSDCDQQTTSSFFFSPAKALRGGSVSAAVGGSGAQEDTPFASLTSRFGSRFQALSRWRSGAAASRRSYGSLSGAPASEPALSRAPSSRSSSLSGRAVVEAPMPMTPSISYYGSTDSIAVSPTTVPAGVSAAFEQPATAAYDYTAASQVPSPVTTAAPAIDLDQADVRRSLERDRTMSTTPLLPPLFTDIQPPASPLPLSLHSSPFQSPTIASPSLGTFSDGTNLTISTPTSFDTSSFTPVMPPTTSVLGTPFPEVLPSPPLSTKISISSFHPPTSAAPPPALEQQDEWSDRLGHANYTILPKPYVPESPNNIDSLHLLRADWNQARANYTKHLARVGEHYGTTSNTYMLTEAKWAETEREWKSAHESVIAEVLAQGDSKECATVRTMRLHDDVPSTMPKIRDTQGKFPDMGDEDIVGPMYRETSMARRESWTPAEKRPGRFWRSIAGRVGIRKHTL